MERPHVAQAPCKSPCGPWRVTSRGQPRFRGLRAQDRSRMAFPLALAAVSVSRGSQQAEEAFRFLGPRLAAATEPAAAKAFLQEAAAVVAEMLASGPKKRRVSLDGLVDLRQRNESHPRTWRKRVHQALLNLSRFLLDDLQRLEALPAAVKAGSLRHFVEEAVAEKRRLRRLSRSFGSLHEQVLRTRSPNAELAAAYRDAALENMRKRWNVAFHEWCAEAIIYYYLLDRKVRQRWVYGSRGDRPRETVISGALRLERGSDRCLPQGPAACRQLAEELPDKVRLLDVGSCANYFGRRSEFEVTALDLAPAEESVLSCNCLELRIGPSGSMPVVKEGLLRQLPAEGFDVAVLALLLSYVPDPLNRARIVAKVRKLLPANNNGLLIIADTVPAIGRYESSSRRPCWISSVEAAGFRLLRDPQMHFAKLRDRTGVVNRAACFSFCTAARGDVLRPLRLVHEEKAPPRASKPGRSQRGVKLRPSPPIYTLAYVQANNLCKLE
ncbi:unnamed protein product, partial [Effrenium voratum]